MNQQAVFNLIALGEGYTTEFKRSMPSDLGREICAFANATGGVILIGVDDAGTVVGVEDHNRLKSQVQSVARSADPPVAVEIDSEGNVLRVTVPEQHGKPYSFGGRFYIREGANSQQLSRDEIREFFFKEGLIRLEETPCNSFDPSVEISSQRWEEFAERAGIDHGLDPMTVLENLHLVRDARMTHAGVLAACRRHHQVHPPGRRNLRRLSRQYQDPHPGHARSFTGICTQFTRRSWPTSRPSSTRRCIPHAQRAGRASGVARERPAGGRSQRHRPPQL